MLQLLFVIEVSCMLLRQSHCCRGSKGEQHTSEVPALLLVSSSLPLIEEPPASSAASPAAAVSAAAAKHLALLLGRRLVICMLAAVAGCQLHGSCYKIAADQSLENCSVLVEGSAAVVSKLVCHCLLALHVVCNNMIRVTF